MLTSKSNGHSCFIMSIHAQICINLLLSKDELSANGNAYYSPAFNHTWRCANCIANIAGLMMINSMTVRQGHPFISLVNSSPPGQKWQPSSHKTFSNEFSWIKMFELLLKFHWHSLSPWVQLTISQHWLRQWFGAEQATSHYLNQCCPIHWRIYAALKGRCVNSFCPVQIDYKTWNFSS